jgi:hypothetical protein
MSSSQIGAGLIALTLVQTIPLPVKPAVKPLGGEQHCDPNIPRDFGNELGYRERGDRCEGLYRTRVASNAFIPIAFDAIQQQIDPPKVANVSLGPSPEPLWLTAVSASPLTPYRMDVRLAPQQRSFAWSTALLQHAGLSGAKVGLYATLDRRLLGKTRQALVAVRCRADIPGEPGKPHAGSPRRQIRLRLGLDLSRAWWTLSRVGAEADQRSTVASARIEGGLLAAERIVNIDLDLSPGGCFLLELGGLLEVGSVTKDLYLCELGN